MTTCSSGPRKRAAQLGNAVPVGVAYALGCSALYVLGYRETDGDAVA